MYKALCALGVFLLLFLPVGCAQKPFSLEQAFQANQEIEGWKQAGDTQFYSRDTLYDLVDGQADAFFAYGFERTGVQNYQNDKGEVIRAEIWQLATPTDAYGLFSTSVAGQPVAMGNGGDEDPGQRVAFWQGRYLAQVSGRPDLPEADVLLRTFAQRFSDALPVGGQPPAVMERLPDEGKVERSAVFFRQEISIQSDVWLGGENLLGLGRETEGALARYALNGQVVYLMLIQYPDPAAATKSLAVLQGGQIDGVLAADAQGALLGAAFGEADPGAASALLALALGR